MASASHHGTNPQLSHYIRAIRAIPLITAEDESALARQWREQQDARAAETLVAAHLRLVVTIAMGYRNYGVPIDELIGEGNLGMMQAIKRFDPNHGARLSTYATWWIRAAIQDYVMRSSSMVRMGTTGAQKKLFFNLRRLKRIVQTDGDGELQPEQAARIADMLGVPVHEVISMNQRMAAPDGSINAPVSVDGGGEWQDWLVDETASQETRIAEDDERRTRNGRLRNAMQNLNVRERHIIAARRLKEEPTPLQELANHYGVSRERIRQIEEKALAKLRRAMTAGAEVLQIQRAAAGRAARGGHAALAAASTKHHSMPAVPRDRRPVAANRVAAEFA